MAILGLDAVNRFFERLGLVWKASVNLWTVIGLTIFYIASQFLFIWLYMKLINALINFKPKVEAFIRRVMMFFD